MERDTIIKLVIVGFILLLLGYGIYSKNYNDNKNTGKVTVNTQPTAQKSGGLFTRANFIWLVILAAGVGGMYLYMKRDTFFTIKSLTNKEQVEIIKKNLVYEEGLCGFYDKKGTLQLPSGSFNVLDKRPTSHPLTGAEFMLYDVEINDPANIYDNGVHTFKVQLNRDKKDIEEGTYGHFRHIDMMSFVRNKMFGKKLPWSHPQSEQMKLAQAAFNEGYDTSEIRDIVPSQTPGQMDKAQPDYLYSDEELSDDEGGSDGQQPQQPFWKRRKKS